MITAEMERLADAPQPETLVIAKCTEGFRVCSPLNPGKQFIVSGLPDNPQCTCPEFGGQPANGVRTCRHVSAVLKDLGLPVEPAVASAPLASNGDGTMLPPTESEKKGANGRNGHGNGAIMLLKRSVSPDGHIDSLSVEFSCPIGKTSSEEIKARALKMLLLQADIAATFLRE